MRPTIIAFLMILVCAITGFAQSPNNVKALKAAKQMDETVRLSKDQFEQVNKAYLNMYRKLEDAQSAKEPDKSKAEYEIKADFNNSLTKILNVNQRSKWYEHNGDDSSPVKLMSPKKKLTPEEKRQLSAKRTTNRISEDLQLTEDQKDKVYKLYLEHNNKHLSLREKTKVNPAEAQEARIRLNEELEKNISTILTEEQKVRMEELRKERVKKQVIIKDNQKVSNQYTKADKIAKKAEIQTNHIATRLNMTEEQKTAFRAASIEKFRALDHMKEISAKKTTQEKNTLRLEIYEEFNVNVAKFLSPEQMEKLKSRVE